MSRLLQAYQQQLTNNPLRTFAAQSGCMSTLGDIVAQQYIQKKENHDWTRTLRSTIYGTCIAGSFSGTWIRLLNRKIAVQPRFKDVLVWLALDSALFLPAFQAVYLTSISALEGRSLLEIQDKFRTTFFTLVRNSYYVWPMANFVSFMFLPPPLRPLLNGTVSVGWNAFQSYQNQLALQQLVHTSPLTSSKSSLKQHTSLASY